MKIRLSDHFTYGKLLKYTFPAIVMMIFTSIYGIVDGYFVSNYAGKVPFAAVNFVMPFIMMLAAAGFMFGTGGSAIIAKSMGEGSDDKAKREFSLFVLAAFICGVIITLLGQIFLRPLCAFLGAEGEMLDYCVRYGRITLMSMPAYTLQLQFQTYFSTAEKPQLGLIITTAAGVTNMVLDYLLVAVIHMGLEGAALATAMSECVGGIVPVIYFARPNSSRLRLTGIKLGPGSVRTLIKACTNGSSELMSNISMSLVGMLFNVQLIKYAGQDGVAAYGVLMYVNMIFIAAFIGYAVGTAPVISYSYGAQTHDEMKSLLKKSLIIIGSCSLLMLIMAQFLARPLAGIFVGYDEALLALTLRGFKIFSFSFLFCGFAIFGSSFFTALSNGFISAVISFLRTLVFEIIAVIVFPIIWGSDGIWASVVIAELMAALLSGIFMITQRGKYHY